jgi:subtilase family serine protease
MKLSKWILSGLAASAALWATSAAAQMGPVQRSGNSYHAAVCPRAAAGPGTAHCHAHVVTDARGNPINGQSEFQPLATPAGYGPADLRSAYNIPAGAGSASYTIAIVDAFGYPHAETDLARYRSQYALPDCTTANGCFRKVDQRGGTAYPRMNTGWAQETALDLDMASAMCSNCHILLVEADSNSFSDLAAAENRAATLGANAISNSYGGGESGSTGVEGAYNHAGVAITVSSGDSGYGVEFPASSPHVTAVGGTHLTRASNTRGWAETAWSGAGSGCSAVYAKPTWQADALCSRRTVADVSAVADPNTGVAVYGPVTSKRSGWMVFGGTSVAAPLIAGVYGANGAKGGTVSYASIPYSHTSALYDVTSGNNGSCGGSYLCTAGPNYDGPTGLGTPKGTTAF